MNILPNNPPLHLRLLIQSLLFSSVLSLSLLSFVTSSEASLLFFRPSGTQIDSDAIKDIETSPGQIIEFRTFLNLDDDAQHTRFLTDLVYDVSFDFTELSFQRANTDIDKNFLLNNSGLTPSNKTGFDRLRLEHHNGFISDGDGAFLDQIFLKVEPGLRNDGIEDFEFSALVVSGGNNLDSITIEQQGVKAVEVQPIQPVPEPPSFFLLGIFFCVVFLPDRVRPLIVKA